MTWLSYIIPRIIFRSSTPYNHDIRVLEESGKPKLLVNGSRQSGQYVRKLWKAALDDFAITDVLPMKKILVLGVAGGDVIHILHSMYPSSHIIGVDIDAEMINVGKKYFHLGEISKTSYFVADAQAFIKKRNQLHTYDLVICDTFSGWSVPDFVLSDHFLDNLKKLLKKDGKVIINYIGEKTYKPKSDIVFMKLNKRFPVVRDHIDYLNRFFMARL